MAAVAVAGLFAACSADDPTRLRGGPGGAGAAGSLPDAAPPAPSSGLQPLHASAAAVPARVRRLNAVEIVNSLHDLFGVPVASLATVHFPAETSQSELDTLNDKLGFGDDVLAALVVAADATATFVTANLSATLACDPVAKGEEACAAELIDRLAPRVYRRPIADDERARLVTLFATTRAADDFPASIAAVVEAMILSPGFVYRTELGGLRAPAAPITSWEIASELSYFLTRSTPDATLLDAARSGKLDTREGIAAEAKRLLADPRAKDAVRSFFAQWLEMTTTTGISKSDPAFTPALAQSMLAETMRFVDEAVWNTPNGYAMLLTAPSSFVDGNLAPIYGVAPPAGAPLVATALDPARRAGFLTQPGFIATHTPGLERSPITLGHFVRAKLLCQTPPPPPPGIPPAPSDPNLDVRARYARHASDPSCSGCHRLMDPIGFGFSQLDVLGRFAPVDHGVTEDGAGELVATDVDGTFHGPVELASKLASSNQVKRCFSGAVLSFVLGRATTAGTPNAIDQGAIDDALASAFGTGDLQALLVALVTTDAFLFRDTTTLGNGEP